MRFPSIAVVCCSFVAATAAWGQSVSLQTDSLPSEQGWSLVGTGLHAGAGETDLFTPGPAAMTFDSMGEPIAISPGSYQARYDFAMPARGVSSDEIRLRARVRIVDSQVLQFNYGFRMAVASGGWGMGLGLSTDLMSYSDLSSTSIDASQWHTYLLIGDLSTQTYDTYVDGQLIAPGKAMYATGGDFAELGDGTGTANAEAEIGSFRATIPAPGAAGLLGLAGTLSLRRRRRV